MFVLADGQVLGNGATITIGADSLIELVLENPTVPPLPSTGFDGALAGVMALMLAAAGALFLLSQRLRRRAGCASRNSLRAAAACGPEYSGSP